MAAEIKAERTALGMTIKTLAEVSGVPEGTLNRMTSKELRDINITQLAAIAGAFELPLEELVERAQKRATRIAASDAAGSNVTTLRPKAAKDMTTDELEGYRGDQAAEKRTKESDAFEDDN